MDTTIFYDLDDRLMHHASPYGRLHFIDTDRLFTIKMKYIYVFDKIDYL